MPERPDFAASNKSLLAQHLTQDVWTSLAEVSDAMGFSFLQAISSGLEHNDSNMGIYAGSADSYRAFAPLLSPVIEAYHGHGSHRLEDSNSKIPELSANHLDAVVSTRIRVARNLVGFPLGPAISKVQRREVEQLIVAALDKLPKDFAGTYRSLASMDEATRAQLVEDHLLFKAGDRFMETAGFNRDWPDGRGFFCNGDNSVLVWVNEEDHLRIISMEQGGDVTAVFERLEAVLKSLGDSLDFAFDDEMGFISSCPSNLGTGLRASVHVPLPHLSDEQRTTLAEANHVQVRGIHGEHSESVGGIFDVSNRRRLGFNQCELVSDMVQGTQALLAQSKSNDASG
jgi:arginine kinase